MARASGRVSKMEKRFFGSSICLVLLLVCTPTTPVEKTMRILSHLSVFPTSEHYSTSGLDDVITALEYNDPFPELAYTELRAEEDVMSALSGLQYSWVDFHHVSKNSSSFGIPLSALPKLLSSTQSFSISPIPGTPHPTQCLFAFPRWPAL